MSDSKLVQEWFTYSQNDLTSAKHLYENLYPKQTEISCYLSQQCAEKALKGYLFFKEIEPPRTYNLVELCQMCIKHDDTFVDILDACSNLTPYGVAVRYPNELAVDEVIAKIAIKDAQIVYDFASSKVQDKIVRHSIEIEVVEER
jgi:HEPN domain-containing protein